MKANAQKRKVFTDAVDLLTGLEPAAGPEAGVQMIPIGSIRPFHNHPFRLYEGERLEDMVESIREHGVLAPVIVLKTEDGYEMLSGHNRMNAAALVGLTELPAIVKEGLGEKEAYVYVIETNMIQRSFSELSISEKAAVLAERYDKIFSQGKRNDIIRELEQISGSEVVTCGHGDHKSKSRESLGDEYGMSGSSVARMLRVNQLIPEFKEMLDDGKLAFVAGVGMSYLSQEEQRMTLEGDVVPDAAQVKQLRQQSGQLTPEAVADILKGKEKPAAKAAAMSFKIPDAWREKYFAGMQKREIEKLIEEALAAWAARKEDADVSTGNA